MEYTFDELRTAIEEGTAGFELQLSLARGLYPLEPVERLEVLLILLKSGEDVLKKEALSTLQKLPRSLILGVAGSSQVSPELLDRMARLFSKHEDILEAVIVNPVVVDMTVSYVAGLAFPRLLEVIGRNQERLDREKSIIENLRSNPVTPKAIISLWDEAEVRKNKEEDRKEADGQAEVDRDNLPALLVEEQTEKEEGWQEAREAQKESVIQMLRGMSAGERVAMAMKGNGEVRKVLIRDKNRLISEKVLENPRITDSEVEAFAKSTNVSEDVLRNIAANREWARQPAIMRSLVYNPKTPLGMSMGFLKRLSIKDLEFLGKSKNVPEVLRRTAKKMHKQKLEKRG